MLRSFCLRSQLKLFSSIFSFSRFPTMVGVKSIRSVLFSLWMILHKLEVFLIIKFRDSIPSKKCNILYPIVVSFLRFIFDSMSPGIMIWKVCLYLKLTHNTSQKLFSNVFKCKAVQLFQYTLVNCFLLLQRIPFILFTWWKFELLWGLISYSCRSMENLQILWYTFICEIKFEFVRNVRILKDCY